MTGLAPAGADEVSARR
ncbi:hypothetical protein [Mycobacterium ostraviense]|nr:hypothetical protein [Mycobacterium ostraviense]UGT94290.1 hypothetical protein LTS72_09950 [Mycobacterium ostraviense]